MRNNLNKIISFYKNYYKDLDVGTIKSSYFINFLEFDIFIRFNLRPTREDLKIIIEAIPGG